MSNQNLVSLLVTQYGPLMSLDDLAEVIGSTPRRVSNGFANGLPWCAPFRQARIKIGRRVRLNTVTVAQILEEKQAAENRGLLAATQLHRLCNALGPRVRGGYPDFQLPMIHFLFLGFIALFGTFTARPNNSKLLLGAG